MVSWCILIPLFITHNKKNHIKHVMRLWTILIIILFISNIWCSVHVPSPELCQLSTGFSHQFICTYMIINTTNTPESQCILEAFYRDGYSTVLLVKFRDIITRNVLVKPNVVNCNTYILLVQDINTLRLIFSRIGGHGRFYPFTNILVILALASRPHNILEYNQDIFTYITKNSLNVVWSNFHNFVYNTKNMEFHRVLSDELIHVQPMVLNSSRLSGWSETIRIFDEEKLINELLRNDHKLMNIRASFFQCPPFVYYVKRGNHTTYDGIEYRFLHETTKNWHTKYTLRDPTKESPNPWRMTLNDLGNNISDISMCSVWLIELHFHMCDLSEPYDSQCATFVVPKPTLLTQASLIYMPLSYEVWTAFVITLASTIVLLKFFSYAGRKLFRNSKYETQFKSMGLATIEVINIVTSHGLKRFPVQLPFKVLIISWIIFSLLLGTGYNTGFTSLLTSPTYSKSIDMVSDFIEQGIGWGEPGKYPEMLDEFRQTGKAGYAAVADRFVEEDSYATVYKKLESGKYGKFVKRLSDNFVTESDSYLHLSNSLQVMKECLGKYYTTFAFQKQSPFRKIFNRQIPRYISYNR